MTVKLEDLERVSSILFAYLKEQGRTQFEVADDYYWEVRDADLYDPLKDPSELNLGQLSHDLERLSEIQNGTTPPVGYALKWLGAVLSWVGQKSGV